MSDNNGNIPADPEMAKLLFGVIKVVESRTALRFEPTPDFSGNWYGGNIALWASDRIGYVIVVSPDGYTSVVKGMWRYVPVPKIKIVFDCLYDLSTWTTLGYDDEFLDDLVDRIGGIEARINSRINARFAQQP